MMIMIIFLLIVLIISVIQLILVLKPKKSSTSNTNNCKNAHYVLDGRPFKQPSDILQLNQRSSGLNIVLKWSY